MTISGMTIRFMIGLRRPFPDSLIIEEERLQNNGQMGRCDLGQLWSR